MVQIPSTEVRGYSLLAKFPLLNCLVDHCVVSNSIIYNYEIELVYKVFVNKNMLCIRKTIKILMDIITLRHKQYH